MKKYPSYEENLVNGNIYLVKRRVKRSLGKSTIRFFLIILAFHGLLYAYYVCADHPAFC